MLKTISITVTGKVQGVWFRKYTVEKANELGVTGYVRNLPDESVYILATGSEEQLNAFSQWCYTGSPKSKVEQVIVKEETLNIIEGFHIVR